MDVYLKTLLLSIAILLGQLNGSLAQTTLQGKVIDEVSEEPVQGANVQALKSNRQAVTNANGQFELKLTVANDTLKISHIGYGAQYLEAKKGTNNTYALISTSLNKQEVQVEAYEESIPFENVAGGMNLLNQQDLQRDAEVSMVSSLSRVPGVLFQNGTFSTGKMSIRGIGSRSRYTTTKIKAYYQGIPITTGEGVTTIEDLDPELMQKTAILKGPSSSIYGAGLGGVVLLRPNYRKSSHTSISQKTMIGSFGLFKSHTAFQHSEDGSQFSVNYLNTHSDGWRDNSTYDKHTINANGAFDVGEDGQLNVLASHIEMKGLIPSSLDQSTFNNNPSSAAESWDNAKGYEDYSKTLLGLSLNAQVAENLHQTTSIFGHFKHNDEPRPFNVLREGRFSRGARTKWAYTPTIGNVQSTFIVGGEYFNEWYKWQIFENVNRSIGPQINENEQWRTYLNLYAKGSFSLNTGTRITAGVNYNQTNYELTDLYIDTLNQTGEYQLFFSLDRGTESKTIQKTVSVYEKPHADFTYEKHGYQKITFEPKSKEALDHHWIFGDGSTSQQNNPVHYYTSEGNYEAKLVVKSDQQCKDTTETKITIEPLPKPDIRNIFTPNGDGKNDVFKIKIKEPVYYHLVIKDEKGNEIFETNDHKEFWNGTNSRTGKKEAAGQYIYQLQYKYKGQKSPNTQQGNLNLRYKR
ncbi:MAG: hypothetical protein BRD49_02700 [Bacteroidetes bacterium SW_10_40_5]|nr:MAG: hypothetical protein BRD49_02700 [Bacteroidetes bacterium SW_10_40_5]